VARAQLEAWLQRDCREVLQALDAATMLDLLSTHTYGERQRAVGFSFAVQPTCFCVGGAPA
jgi:hypothetical protein